MIMVMPVPTPAERTEPTLKPNQPTHSSEPPIIVSARLWGTISEVAVSRALADEDGGDQAGDGGVDVHHRAAGEVEHAGRAEEAARTPDHVGDRGVDEHHPTATGRSSPRRTSYDRQVRRAR